MIAGTFLAADVAVDAGFLKPRRDLWTEQEMIEPQAGIARPALTTAANALENAGTTILLLLILLLSKGYRVTVSSTKPRTRRFLMAAVATVGAAHFAAPPHGPPRSSSCSGNSDSIAPATAASLSKCSRGRPPPSSCPLRMVCMHRSMAPTSL